VFKLAVIGCGHWGPNHIRVFGSLPDSRVEAVVDLDEKSRLRVARTGWVSLRRCLCSSVLRGVDWRFVDPQSYSHVVFVCGPFGNGWPITEFLPRFAGCRIIGLILSMLEPLDAWNPFEFLLERDSSAASRPDISFLSRRTQVPVVSVVLVHHRLSTKGACTKSQTMPFAASLPYERCR
jgi:hypothetical protein